MNLGRLLILAIVFGISFIPDDATACWRFRRNRRYVPQCVPQCVAPSAAPAPTYYNPVESKLNDIQGQLRRIEEKVDTIKSQ